MARPDAEKFMQFMQTRADETEMLSQFSTFAYIFDGYDPDLQLPAPLTEGLSPQNIATLVLEDLFRLNYTILLYYELRHHVYSQTI